MNLLFVAADVRRRTLMALNDFRLLTSAATRFRDSKREISFRRILTLALSLRERGTLSTVVYEPLIGGHFAARRLILPLLGDLSCLGSNERNSPKAKALRGPSERALASHWAGMRADVASRLNCHGLEPHFLAGQ
jgi:hypothetical protein